MRVVLLAAALLLVGCSTRQRLHIATAADLATTHAGLQRGGREANPVLDGLSIGQMAAGNLLLNEAVLLWERKACRNEHSSNCATARMVRRSMTGSHASAAVWNGYQLNKN